MSGDHRLIRVGWALYVLVWLLLFANIAYDLINYKWISPLSILLLLILGGGSLLMRARGLPLIDPERYRTRAVFTLIVVLVILAGVLAYTIIGMVGAH
jgi:hypothetical protein